MTPRAPTGSFSAMTTTRPYRKAMPMREALLRLARRIKRYNPIPRARRNVAWSSLVNDGMCFSPLLLRRTPAPDGQRRSPDELGYAYRISDPAQFAGMAELETATDAIRAEYEALVELKTAELVPYTQYPDHVPLAQWRELNNNPAWTAIHLLQNGRRVEANAAHCPKTLEALSKLPQPRIPGASPNAMFSLLAPNTRIPPHTGVANVRLVAHLPLIVPGGCGFRVGGTTIEWKAGEAVVFDDTSTVNAVAMRTAITIAWTTRRRALAASRAPRARAMAEDTPPPIAPAEVICSSMMSGKTSARPARGTVPRRPTK